MRNLLSGTVYAMTNERLTQAELDAIGKRASMATAGPWEIFDGSSMYGDGAILNGRGEPVFIGVATYDMSDAYIDCYDEDAEFIAKAREDVPKLVEALVQDRAEVERLRTVIEDAISIGEMQREDFLLEPWASLVNAVNGGGAND